MNENKTKLYLALFGLVVIVSLFLYSTYRPTPDGYTYGTIMEKRLVARGSKSTVAYRISGEMSYSYIGSYENYPIDEKFVVYFNHKWADQASVDQTAPIFLASEQVDWALAKIIRTSSSDIEFEYTIDGLIYKRWQNIHEAYRTGTVGDTIRIVYWRENPQRSIFPDAYSRETLAVISADENFKNLNGATH